MSSEKFNGGGGGVVVACLSIVSLQVLSFENVTLNSKFRVKTLTWTMDHFLDAIASLELGHDCMSVIYQF